jgi:hypothetical protein
VPFNNQRGKKESERNEKEKDKITGLHIGALSANDGRAVGYSGTIIGWIGTVWVPEFTAAIIASLLITITSVAVTTTKMASKKRRSPLITSKNKNPAVGNQCHLLLFSTGM